MIKKYFAHVELWRKKTSNIDGRKGLVSNDVSESDLKIIGKHVRVIFLGMPAEPGINR